MNKYTKAEEALRVIYPEFMELVGDVLDGELIHDQLRVRYPEYDRYHLILAHKVATVLMDIERDLDGHLDSRWLTSEELIAND